MAQQTFNNLTDLFSVRTVLNANATDAEARLSALTPTGPTGAILRKTASSGLGGSSDFVYTQAGGLVGIGLGSASLSSFMGFTNFSALNFRDGAGALLGRLYNDGGTAIRLEGGTIPLTVNGVALSNGAGANTVLHGDGLYKTISGGGGGITQIAVSGGLGVTNPTGPTAIIDGSVIQNAAASAQSDATQALSDAATAQGTANAAGALAASAQSDATQAISDAAAAQSTANNALTLAGSAVQSVVAGTGINVDATDPNNPVVSAIGGGSGYDTIQEAGSPVAQQSTLNIIGGTNITVDVSDDAPNNRTNLTISAAGGAAGTQGVETYSVVLSDGNQFMSNNTLGRLYLMAVIPEQDSEVADLSFVIAQNNGGNTGGVGVYDQNGILLGYSSLQGFSLGSNTIDLEFDGSRNPLGAPLMLNGGQLYYFALEAAINSCAPMSIQGSGVYNPPGGTANPLAFFVPNSRSVHVSGFPANVSAFFGQVGGDARKYYMVGTST